jgi:hypothetical protein
MFTDNPNIRRTLYIAAIVLSGAAIVLKHIPSPWAVDAAEAVTELVVYTSGLAGLVAAGHVNPLPPEEDPVSGPN